jgi:hypothetical protein
MIRATTTTLAIPQPTTGHQISASLKPGALGQPALMLPMRSSVARASTDEIAPAKAPARPAPPRASAQAKAEAMTPAQAAPATHWTAINTGSVAASVAPPAAAAATSAVPLHHAYRHQRLPPVQAGTRLMLGRSRTPA